MKKVLILLMVLYSTIVNAQTIHWLTFIDTTDPNVGEMDKNSRALLYSRFIGVVNAALAEAGYKTDIQDYYGTRLTPQNCKSAVQQLKCGPNDVVVFYYIGHGTHAARENNRYPQMMMGRGWEKEQQFIPLQWVHNQLKSKGARLSVTIGMCCNPVQSATAKNAPTFNKSDFRYNYGATYVTEQEINNIQKLFLEAQGNIIQGTASINELSWGYSWSDMGNTDTFTRSLILQFEKQMKTGTTSSWESFLGTISNTVSSTQKEILEECPRIAVEAKPYKPTQTPINDISVTRATRPSISKPQAPETKTPTPKQVPTDDDEWDTDDTNDTNVSDSDRNLLNSFNEIFEYALSSKLSDTERENFAETIIAKHKSLVGLVKILPQDGKTVIDRCDFSTYMERISTSGRLLKVTPVSVGFDSSGRLSVSVREVYKR